MIQLLNDTGQMIDAVDVMYDIFYLNDQERGNTLNFEYSTDGSAFTPLSMLDFTTPEASDSLGWQSVNRMATLTGLGLAPGQFLTLNFVTDDAVGSGSRDELGIDNIMVTVQDQPSIPEPATALLGLAAAGVLGIRRRRRV